MGPGVIFQVENDFQVRESTSRCFVGPKLPGSVVEFNIDNVSGNYGFVKPLSDRQATDSKDWGEMSGKKTSTKRMGILNVLCEMNDLLTES